MCCSNLDSTTTYTKMAKPIILSIDDDPQVLRAIGRDLKEKYRSDYRVLSATSGQEALSTLVELKKKGELVALLLSDHRMPEMNGVSFLDKAKEIYPEAKTVLLTGYSDTEAAIKAINEVRLNYYLLKPWDPPQEKLYPVLGELLEDWKFDGKNRLAGIKLIGYQFSPKSHHLKDFLSGNLIPYVWMDIETSEDAKELLALNNIDLKNLPAIFFEDGSFLVSPEITQVASKIGFNPKVSSELYDVVIIGAGPAGLAAAVYGASEGLKTLLIEKHAPGGQAGTSSRIENYLGFPSGLSGSELARRAITQATRFGTEFLSPQEVVSIELKDNYKILHLSDGSTVTSKSVVIATGVSYRQLEIEGLSKFSGAGVYYGAANTEAIACKNKSVYIVGGGNSAGQAAMFLSQFARNVFIVIRGKDLSSTMSSYLIDQINVTKNISVLSYTEVIEASGNDRLEKIKLKNNEKGTEEVVDAETLFIFIGAKPMTSWLPQNIQRNEKEFLVTGRDLLQFPNYKEFWPLKRDPYLLETSVPGIFAAGDVRATAMNRVASATGEGAMSISLTHKYLGEV
jgi:thioredoxin reductase (NADPH)